MSLVFAAPAPPTVEVSGRSERFPVHRIYCVGRNYAAHVREMGGPIRTGTRLAEIPHQCARRDDEGGQQRACTMADVRMLALFRFPRLHWLGRVRTL